MEKQQSEDGSGLMNVVRAAAISPAEATRLVGNLRGRYSRMKGEGDAAFHLRTTELVADRIIARYAKLAATSGGVTALAGVVPGVGTILAAVGGGAADVAVTMKLQVDMCISLAAAYDWDPCAPDAYDMAMLLAVGASLEKLSTGVTAVASRAGVKLIKQYLKGSALVVLKQMFKSIGIAFSRKALERALPLGIGVVISGTSNYALARYTGAQAKAWFKLEKTDSANDTVEVEAAASAWGLSNEAPSEAASG